MFDIEPSLEKLFLDRKPGVKFSRKLWFTIWRYFSLENRANI